MLIAMSSFVSNAITDDNCNVFVPLTDETSQMRGDSRRN